MFFRSIQVDHQLFALSKLDITGDGRDEIIACSWDGQTYILDQEKHSVRFQLEESVSSFCAGLYTLEAGKPPVPCIIYTTFTNKVCKQQVQNFSTLKGLYFHAYMYFGKIFNMCLSFKI